MNFEEREKLRKNCVGLIENIILPGELLDHLYESGVISEVDIERIKAESISYNRVRQLLRILHTKPGCLGTFCESLDKSGYNFLATAIRETEVDPLQIEKAQQEVENQVHDILADTYETSSGGYSVPMQEIVKEVEFGLLTAGKHWKDKNVLLIEALLKKLFPTAKPKKRKKKGNRSTTDPVYHCLKRKSENMDHQCAEGDSCRPQMELGMTNKTFNSVLKQYFIERTLDFSLVDVLIKKKVTKEIFMNLSMEEIGDIYPSLKFVEIKEIVSIRNELKEKEDAGDIIFDDGCPTSEERGDDSFSEKFRETFRKFGCTMRESSYYRLDSALMCDRTDLSSLLQPIHKFVYEEMDIQSIPDWIANIAMPFIAACLNERRNGTIHFGIIQIASENRVQGTIVGIPVPMEKRRIVRRFYSALQSTFYDDDYESVCKCVFQPQFIPVIGSRDSKGHLYVVEIDVKPSSLFTEENVFFTRNKSGDYSKKKLMLYRLNKCSNEPNLVNDEEFRNYMAIKSKIRQERKKQEENPMDIRLNENLQQKFLDLFSAGFETMKEEVHPVLLLSPLEDNVEDEFVAENFQFLIDIDPEVVFDFDSCSKEIGMYQFVENDQEQCLKVLTTDSFDKSSEEHVHKKDSYINLLDDLKETPTKPWIFCNGHVPTMKEPLSRFQWKQQRIEGFKEAVRFYSSEIPHERAVVIFILLSKNYEVLLDAAEEVISKFQNHWMMLAENEEIANHWKKELVHRQCVDKKTLDYRCVIGIPWSQVNLMIKAVVGATQLNVSFIPTANGAPCHLKEKLKSELFDLEILCVNECENDLDVMKDITTRMDRRKSVEAEFFKGASVTWWNLWFKEDHVLKRSIHTRLLEMVKLACSKSDNEDQGKVSIVTLFHQPGAGGTTSAKQILWELRKEYRCAVVKRISNFTCEQINRLRTFNEQDTPKPPIVLIDNGDEDKLFTLCSQLENRAKIASRRLEDQCQVFCVLLLCVRRPNLSLSTHERSVQLRHELENVELDWFQKKGEFLKKQHMNENGVDPRLLLSFNLLKENFNEKYRQEVIQQFVDNIEDEKEMSLLRYLSLMNSFDLDFQSVPISAFDLLMTDKLKESTKVYSFGIHSPQRRVRKRGWEVNLTQSLLVLINRGARVQFSAQLKGLCIINQLFAKEILKYLQGKLNMTTSDIMIEFLKSPMFNSYNKSVEVVQKIVKDILKKRQILGDNKREKFSPLITDILQHEDSDKAGEVLMFGFELLDDPMVAQQVARLYYNYKNWEKAEEFANIATGMVSENSFLWDTYGQVFKTQLKEMYMECSKSNDILTEDQVSTALCLTSKAIDKFRCEQTTCEKEHQSKNNDNGYFAEVATIVTFLDLLSFFPDTNNIATLRRFLVEPKFVPPSFEFLDPEKIKFIKTFNERTNCVMRFISEKNSQLKWGVYSDFLSNNPDQRKLLFDLKENLDKYFGEESIDLPVLQSGEETADHIRRRVLKLSGRDLKTMIDLRVEDGKKTLLTIESLIQENLLPHHLTLPDLITLISARVARCLNTQGQGQEFLEILTWTKHAYEMSNKLHNPHIYLESFLFFVLFHWQTENKKAYAKDICPVQQLQEAIGKWRNAFNIKYPRQKDENNPHRKRETTYFYLGNGVQFAEIVYYEDLFIDEHGLRYLRKGDSIWQKPAIRRRLNRLQGTLKPSGTEVLVPLKSSEGNVNPVTIPTSLPITDRTLYNKTVYFFLGFTWSGPKAFDVSLENRHVDEMHLRKPPRSQLNPYPNSRGYRQASTEVTTNEGFLKKLTEINDKLQKIESDRTGNVKLKKEKLTRERDDLMRRRDAFLSQTAAAEYYRC